MVRSTTLLSISLIIFSLIMGVFATTNISIPVFLLFVVYFICLIKLYQSCLSAKRDMASLSFWFYWSYLVVLPAISQVSSGSYYWVNGISYSDSLSIRGSLILLIYFSGFFIGERSFYRNKFHVPNKTENKRNFFDSSFLVSRPVFILTIFLSVSLLIVFFTARNYVFYGDTAKFLLNVDPVKYNLSIVLPRQLAFSVAFFGIYLLKYYRIKLRKFDKFLIVAIIITDFIYCWYIANPLTETRYLTLSSAIIIFMIFVRRPNAIYKNGIWLVMLSTMFTLFPPLRELRMQGKFEVQEGPLAYLQHADVDGFQSIMNVISMVDDRGHYYGLQILSAVFFFVPRSIWPGKSVGTGDLAAHYAQYVNFNVSSPLPSEFYADFGWLGVFIFGVMSGWFIRFLDRQLIEDNSWRFLIATAVTGYLMILLRGSLIGVIAPVVVLVWALWALGRASFGVRSLVTMNRVSKL